MVKDFQEIGSTLKERLRKGLLEWFRLNKRDLPWRGSYNPYHVWISEIMLQQTQMERGVRYFNRWIEKFPDLQSVAQATEHEILKAWEGLGYYSRARNLHGAAKILDEQYRGRIPCDPEVLMSLPGIGPYTAAAVSSIACNRDVPVVDANVERVYARIFDIDQQVKSGPGKRLVKKIAGDLLVPGKARNFNQALMEFGGVHCLPKTPKCSSCPVKEDCLASLRGTIPLRPMTRKGRGTVRIEMVTGILAHEGRLFIQQRKTNDIWGGLWEFPGGQLEEGESAEDALEREFLEETGYSVEVGKKITTVTHGYMHYKVVLHSYVCFPIGNLKNPVLTAAQDYTWVKHHNLRQFAFPAGHRKLLDHIQGCCPGLFEEICTTVLPEMYRRGL